MKKWSCLLTLLFAGCMVGPDYEVPEYIVPDEWVGESQDSEDRIDNAPVLAEWWILLEDPQLDQYICMAATYNNDILTAEANILQARAYKMVTASAFYPQISADINASRTYFSKNGPIFAANSFTAGVSPTTGLPFQVQVPQIQNLFNALIDVSWEIDLFGKTCRAVQGAQAMLDASVEQRNDVLITVLAETARNYVEIRSNQKLGLLIQQNIDLLERNVEIAQKRYKAGYTNNLDLLRIEAEVASAKATLPNVLAEIYKGIYALAALTGNLPEDLADELLPIKPLPTTPSHVGVGLRSDLLRRRPDVRYAEREFAATVADVGVAVASFYPSFTLIGDIGLQSIKASNWFTPGSKTWSFGAGTSIPIFQGGQLIGNLELTEAAAAAAHYTYQQTILVAVQEAETSLIAYEQDLKTIELQQEAVEKTRKVAGLSNTRYTSGLVNVTDLLDTERQLNAAEQNLLQNQTAALLDLIKLYKALGGGWDVCFD